MKEYKIRGTNYKIRYNDFSGELTQKAQDKNLSVPYNLDFLCFLKKLFTWS